MELAGDWECLNNKSTHVIILNSPESLAYLMEILIHSYKMEWFNFPPSVCAGCTL